MERKFHPAWILMVIPVQLAIDFIAVKIASKMDALLGLKNAEIMGHSLPEMAQVVTLVFGVITIAVAVEAVIRTIIGMTNYTKRKREIDD